MTTLQLKNHQIWQDLTEILENLDTNSLVQKHLEQCFYTINGYWDEQDEYYDSIRLPHTIEAELVSSFVGVTQDNRFLKLKFSLIGTDFGTDCINPAAAAIYAAYDDKSYPFGYPTIQNIGELVLIYNENLEFVDENWLLDIDSPLLDKRQFTNT
ncbi:hypothetical protein H6G25_19105 [Dolichospermum sp. FACHB-1091]|uniref:hypothetical protein n=1 Tax=Dolichospermum sp. FACHB-1091 TaxID=2692798 RepID=UPI0016803D6C|nr:hypothetical protein [Dolichospermum sp. FACHB-1091]MBD2445244.1 hypothetical protein [Dolichospermum sp. FACHB-1091]